MALDNRPLLNEAVQQKKLPIDLPEYQEAVVPVAVIEQVWRERKNVRLGDGAGSVGSAGDGVHDREDAMGVAE